MGTLVVSCLDMTLRIVGGAPTYLLTDNEKTVTIEHVATELHRIGSRHAADPSSEAAASQARSQPNLGSPTIITTSNKATHEPAASFPSP